MKGLASHFITFRLGKCEGFYGKGLTPVLFGSVDFTWLESEFKRGTTLRCVCRSICSIRSFMSDTSVINVSSWNVRGLNKIVKLKQVLGRIKQMKSTICFLQETHLVDGDLNRIRSRWPGQIFSSNFTTHARGIIILIHKSVPFDLKDKYLDPSGRFIILSRTIIATFVNFVVYMPPMGRILPFTNITF